MGFGPETHQDKSLFGKEVVMYKSILSAMLSFGIMLVNSNVFGQQGAWDQVGAWNFVFIPDQIEGSNPNTSSTDSFFWGEGMIIDLVGSNQDKDGESYMQGYGYINGKTYTLSGYGYLDSLVYLIEGLLYDVEHAGVFVPLDSSGGESSTIDSSGLYLNGTGYRTLGFGYLNLPDGTTAEYPMEMTIIIDGAQPGKHLIIINPRGAWH